MAFIDATVLASLEDEARNGNTTALYNLGIAYSTGQGVPTDYVTAHKFFNLAAMGGLDEARGLRAELSREMSKDEIAEAQRQARAWLRPLLSGDGTIRVA